MDNNGNLVLKALADGNIDEARNIMKQYPDCEFALEDNFIIDLFKNNKVNSLKYLVNEIGVYQDSGDESYLAVKYGDMEMIKFWINKEFLPDDKFVYEDILEKSTNTDIINDMKITD